MLSTLLASFTSWHWQSRPMSSMFIMLPEHITIVADLNLASWTWQFNMHNSLGSKLIKSNLAYWPYIYTSTSLISTSLWTIQRFTADINVAYLTKLVYSRLIPLPQTRSSKMYIQLWLPKLGLNSLCLFECKQAIIITTCEMWH